MSRTRLIIAFYKCNHWKNRQSRHDLKNQLAVHMGFLEILGDTQVDLPQNEYFQNIRIAERQISAIIEFTKEYEHIGVNAPFWHYCRTLVGRAAKEAHLVQVVVKNDCPCRDGGVCRPPHRQGPLQSNG